MMYIKRETSFYFDYTWEFQKWFYMIEESNILSEILPQAHHTPLLGLRYSWCQVCISVDDLE